MRPRHANLPFAALATAWPDPLRNHAEVNWQEWPTRLKPAPAIGGTVVKPLRTETSSSL